MISSLQLELHGEAGAALARLASEVATYARAHQLAEHEEHALQLVLEEAVDNAFRHGGARRVRVALDRSRGAIEIRLEDDGKAFDASTGPTSPPDPDRVGGHGLSLIRTFASNVSYERREAGNVLAMTVAHRQDESHES